ncbi:MAG: putative motility protein [bacterium]|nr:putative motility protein [bacterium]
MSMSAITNTGHLGQVDFDKLTAAYPSKSSTDGTSAAKGAMEVQEMVQEDLSKMMRDVTPHLGQNLDLEA